MTTTTTPALTVTHAMLEAAGDFCVANGIYIETTHSELSVRQAFEGMYLAMRRKEFAIATPTLPAAATASAPGHTDLMISPEAIDEVLASEPGAEAREVVARIREPMYPHNSMFDESDPPLYSHSPEDAAALVQSIIDARDEAQMELKRHFPISKYNGLGIEEWQARAEAAEARRAEANNQWRLDYNELATKLAKAREALKEITERHVPDQPAALSMPEADYVRKHHTELRRIARAALKEIGE